MWKIRQHTALCRNQSTITSMASLALCGMLPGMILGSADKIMFNRAFEQGFAQSANAKHGSTNPNKTNSNASVDTVSRPSGPFKPHSLPVNNLYIIDESDDAGDNEDLRNLVTGSNSSVGPSGSTYNALQHSIRSDLGHSILIIPNGSPATRKSVSFGHREMEPLLEHQTSEEADEYCVTVDHIEPNNNSNETKASHPIKRHLR